MITREKTIAVIRECYKDYSGIRLPQGLDYYRELTVCCNSADYSIYVDLVDNDSVRVSVSLRSKEESPITTYLIHNKNNAYTFNYPTYDSRDIKSCNAFACLPNELEDLLNNLLSKDYIDLTVYTLCSGLWKYGLSKTDPEKLSEVLDKLTSKKIQ